MWLLPVASPLARALTRLYHRLNVAGGTVPREGPVLLVTNHPNSLIDPATVLGVAGRPVRFLAKHTLWSERAVGWMVRGAGAIPVYRRQDDPSLAAHNEDAFRAVHQALAEGSAVGIFPEGISHSEPSIAPLKTGAARIALETALRIGRAFPIVPVGLTFAEREAFRSEGLVVVGEPVAWDDLAGESGPEAVRELTARIEAGLRRVTVNLASWKDARLVHAAEAVFAAESGADPDPARRIERLKEITDTLEALRARGGGEWERLARGLETHEARLRRLRLRATDLHAAPGGGAVARWTLRNVPFLGVVGIVLTLLGSLLFWAPYRLVGVLERTARPSRDVRSTYKLIAGVVVYAAWIVGLAALAALGRRWVAGLGVLVGLPALGLLTLVLRERWRAAILDARRFFLLRFRPRLVVELQRRQAELGARLRELRALTPRPPAPGKGESTSAARTRG